MPREKSWTVTAGLRFVPFNLTDFDCEPEEITKRIGIEPSKTWSAGEPIMGCTRAHKESGWRLELKTKMQVESRT